jgi:hypothetical protein
MAGMVIPFEGAAHKVYRELMYTTTVTPGAATVDISPPGGKIKPYGYLRSLLLYVRGTGGTGGNLAADAPWNFFSNVQVTLPNGQELYGDPNWSGYHAYLAAKHSASRLNNDPSTWPTYLSSATAPTFVLPIIFETNAENGWCCLPQTPHDRQHVHEHLANGADDNPLVHSRRVHGLLDDPGAGQPAYGRPAGRGAGRARHAEQVDAAVLLRHGRRLAGD